jgi:hypothetical protein
VVHHGIISGVIVTVFDSCVVHHGIMSGVIVTVFDSCVVHHGIESLFSQTKDY